MQETIRPAGVAKTTSHNKRQGSHCQSTSDRLKGAPEEDCTGTRSSTSSTRTTRKAHWLEIRHNVEDYKLIGRIAPVKQQARRSGYKKRNEVQATWSTGALVNTRRVHREESPRNTRPVRKTGGAINNKERGEEMQRGKAYARGNPKNGE